MFALAINASPRKKGNTEMLLEKVLDPIQKAGWKTDTITIGAKPMYGCIACLQCLKKKNNQCAITKDAFNEIFARMNEADALILGTPTYFTDVTAELKALIDRAGYVSLVNGRTFSGKIGAAVVAVRRGGATHAFDTINHLFQISGMLIPGSRYWNMGYGLREGEVASDDEGLANMQHLGEMIVWLGNAIQPNLSTIPK